MKEIIKMLVVTTLICGVCGFLLASVRSSTKERIEEQVLQYVKGPALESVLQGAKNNIIKDRVEVTVGARKLVVFIGKKNGKPFAVSYESIAKGRDDDIGVMVGVDLKNEKLTGVAITANKDSPGFGSKENEKIFTGQYKGKTLSENFNLRNNNGTIDSISGATITSTGASNAVKSGVEVFRKIKTGLKKKGI